jgi:7-cyano-7-deazaguanine synthase in queuosine biosynthesis
MARSPAPLSATVVTERSASGRDDYEIAFDLTRDLKIDIPGPLGPRPMDDVASDLLDIAMGVHFLERDQRKKAETNRVRLVKVKLPVRNLDLWKPLADPLCDLLRFMGGYDWRVEFVESRAQIYKADSIAEHDCSKVVLNSGGMDATCGLSTLVDDAKRLRLASFYTLNSKIQRHIAEDLGFVEPSRMRAVWRNRSERRGNGALSYRSFLFLSFGTVVARSFGATELLQFENGVMARAVPPAASYFTTRHSHPKTHRLFREFVTAAGFEIAIDNPFGSLTKGQEVAACRRALKPARANRLLALTDSCWYFHYQRVPVRYGRGVIPKSPRRHCGICMPCLVRRAAFGDSDYVFDPCAPPQGKVDARNFTYNYRALQAFCRIVMQTRDGPEFRRALSRNGIAAGPETGTWDELQQLYKRFSGEFLRAFNDVGEP